MTTVGRRFGEGREGGGVFIVPSTTVETALSSVCLPLHLSFCISGKIVGKERINCSNCVTITLLIETPIKRKLYCNISRHIQVLRTVANIRHGCLPPFSLKRWVILPFSRRINQEALLLMKIVPKSADAGLFLRCKKGTLQTFECASAFN